MQEIEELSSDISQISLRFLLRTVLVTVLYLMNEQSYNVWVVRRIPFIGNIY